MNETNVTYISEWIVLHPSDQQAMPIPETILHDNEIRRAMERSLSQTELEIANTTRVLEQKEYLPLIEVALPWPFQLPEGGSNGTSNSELKEFAYDAYEVLDLIFNNAEWRGWFIATYFNPLDDTRQTFSIGLFIDKSFNQTVVE